MKNKNLKAELNSIYGFVGKQPKTKVEYGKVKLDLTSSYPNGLKPSRNKFIYLGSPMRCLVVKLNEPIEDIPNTVIIKEDYFFAEDETIKRFDYVRYLVKAVNNAKNLSWTMDTDDLLNYLNRAVEIIKETLGEDLNNHKDMLLFIVNVLNMTSLHRKGKIK